METALSTLRIANERLKQGRDWDAAENLRLTGVNEAVRDENRRIAAENASIAKQQAWAEEQRVWEEAEKVRFVSLHASAQNEIAQLAEAIRMQDLQHAKLVEQTTEFWLTRQICATKRTSFGPPARGG